MCGWQMIMENFIVAGILIVLISAVIFYLVREKKKGRKCIGCPYAKQCGNHCSGGCGGEGGQHKSQTASKKV